MEGEERRRHDGGCTAVLGALEAGACAGRRSDGVGGNSHAFDQGEGILGEEEPVLEILEGNHKAACHRKHEMKGLIRDKYGQNA